MSRLSGVSVLVAGAGLAGLAAARDLIALGADVTVVDPRDRVGGRVWTIRDGFADHQHAEGGGDLIDETQHEIRTLTAQMGLTLTRILKNSFGHVREDGNGRPRIIPRAVQRGWTRLAEALAPLIQTYRLTEQRWESPIVAAIARRSVASWLDEVKADADMRATAMAIRGFFLADPDELSVLALVDQFASSDVWGALYRIDGGNDRLTSALAAPLGARLQLNTEVAAISHRGRTVRVAVKNGKTQSQITCDYVIFAVPATTLRRIPIAPSLPSPQHSAIAQLKYGRATRTLLQFTRRFWRANGRPNAFGSTLSFGALWDGNEGQRGKAGILSLLAGGSASTATQTIVAKEGPRGLVKALAFLGSGGSELIASKQIIWEQDPYARGGYAYFDPTYDPAQRAWLARPFGRLFFAGEHTSLRWQGYMNGAVESGRRAAAEVAATHDG